MSWVHEYCAQCPLKIDMLADVRGRPCVGNGQQCPKAPPPWEWKMQDVRGKPRIMCRCGLMMSVVPVVLDLLVTCPLCNTILRVKGTGSWIKKLLARFRLSRQVRQDRSASNLWP